MLFQVFFKKKTNPYIPLLRIARCTATKEEEEERPRIIPDIQALGV